MFLLLIIVTIILGVFHYYTHYSRFGRLLNKLPGPKIIPLLGNISMFVVPPKTAMDTCLNDAGTIEEEYMTAVRKVGDSVVHRVCRPWLHANWVFKLFPSGMSQTKYLSTLHNFSANIIKERKKYHEETGGRLLKPIISERNESSSDEKGQRKRMAMLDHLIAAQQNGEKIDDTGIREEVDTFIFEGHDTTSMAICFTLLMLAENEDVQERARKEVDMVLDENDGKIGSVELQRLNYLEQCIRETLRLYPSVPLISRVLHEDLQLKNYLIPGGTNIHLHIFDLHRDPNFWPNPEKFDPDRFLTERIQGRHPFSYIPFSGGPRNCIGQKFAMLELKALMAHLLHNFNFQAIDHSQEITFITDIVIRPALPIRLKFISRLK
ncbi:cytochrome P450 4C1-like [Belonocnema kinseyi]|uniref:cytochrome P450 4C1-like n=1 Tax=Belonocnema kinseyi TaxID=2817044 RepID=UPI00143D96BE|nr:cytochrome P450 4C1-like [Belonocnema kinseyi]